MNSKDNNNNENMLSLKVTSYIKYFIQDKNFVYATLQNGHDKIHLPLLKSTTLHHIDKSFKILDLDLDLDLAILCPSCKKDSMLIEYKY